MVAAFGHNGCSWEKFRCRGISKVQAERFTTIIGANARPIQPLEGREILEE
jgi:carbonic anhydrase